MSFDRFNQILQSLKKRYPQLGVRLQESDALGRWAAAVGPQIARHSRAIRVQDGTLWVEVDHPVWKSELHYKKRQIIAALNEEDEASKDLKKTTKTAKIEDIFFLDGRSRAR